MTKTKQPADTIRNNVYTAHSTHKNITTRPQGTMQQPDCKHHQTITISSLIPRRKFVQLIRKVSDYPVDMKRTSSISVGSGKTIAESFSLYDTSVHHRNNGAIQLPSLKERAVQSLCFTAISMAEFIVNDTIVDCRYMCCICIIQSLRYK